MNKRILVGIDVDLSPITQHTLHVVSELFEQATPHVYLLLLNVIPIPQVVTSHPGFYIGQSLPVTPTHWQRSQSEEVLYKARLILQQHGIPPDCTQLITRTGVPAEELVKVAKDLRANLIVVGSRGNGFRHRLRHWFLGSISRGVLHNATCPVMIVTLPEQKAPADLVAWYEQAIKHYLSEHPDTLAVFTSTEAARLFVPPPKKTPGRKETAAAAHALESLANDGLLCRHDVKGELRYVND